MDIKKEEVAGQPAIYRMTVNHHDLASTLTNLIPTELRDQGYVVDGNTFKTDSPEHITRVELVLHQTKTRVATGAGEIPSSSDVQRMSAGIKPRLETGEEQQ